MKNKDAIEILTKHNEWRRGSDEHPMVDVKLLGQAIDHAIEVLKASEWREIESVPAAQKVILYNPHRGIANPQRVEVGYGDNGYGSYHS